MSAVAVQTVDVGRELTEKFPNTSFLFQKTADDIPTFWITRESLIDVLAFLKHDYEMLFDLCGVDERIREHRAGLPPSEFTVVYHLVSFRHRRDIRLKIALAEPDLDVPTVINVYPNANWYEREAWDMFGITFTGHPNLFRILLPPTWEGHALRKDHPARATELEPFRLDDKRQDKEQEALRFRPEDWGMKRKNDNTEFRE